LPFWLLSGRAFLKRQLAAHVELNPARFPIGKKFSIFSKEKANGPPHRSCNRCRSTELPKGFQTHLGSV
jgi:methylphosphotriester-DNA--protein-cysteine methyltransferase